MAGIVLSVGEDDQHPGDAAFIGIGGEFTAGKFHRVEDRGPVISPMQLIDSFREGFRVGREVLRDRYGVTKTRNESEVRLRVQHAFKEFAGGAFFERETVLH